jgi:outer membrane protein assembly factor BamB
VGSLQRRQISIEGVVDSSAIYLHGVTVNGSAHDTVFATTSFGRTIAIDAASGAVLWQHTPDGYDSWAGTRQLTNTAPVADPGRQFIYAASPAGKVEKLAVSDGHVVWTTAITTNPQREKMDSPLNLFRGRILAVTGGYIGDPPPYVGHLSVLDPATGAIVTTWNSLCSDRHELIDPTTCPQQKSAIWGRGGAVVDSTTGNIFFATGNGPWDGKTAWADALIELDPTATRMVGNFTPENNEALNAADLDLGAASPALLGGGLIAIGGKDGFIRLLNERAIAGTDPHRGGEVQAVPTPGGARRLGISSALVVLHAGAATWVFGADWAGTAAWQLRDGKLEVGWKNQTPGTSPVVAGGLLYVYDPAGTLHVYEPTTGREVGALACGPGHWNSPIVIDGRIILPEGAANKPGTGIINIWHAQ